MNIVRFLFLIMCISGMLSAIEIDSSKKQLFALRKDDIDEALKLYPKLKPQIFKTIYLPDGSEELFIGEFIQVL